MKSESWRAAWKKHVHSFLIHAPSCRDVTEPQSLAPAVEGCEIVFHAAGFPEQWMKDPAIFQQVNVEGTRNVLNAGTSAGVRRVVYTSTIDVFAARAGESYDESVLDTQPKGTYYERSKQDADRVAVEFLSRGMDIVFIHPAGLYGPGPMGSP
ncbi:MAG TPA: NAD-dependent epimerase/dehydratase family protein, partial [Leptospiraceae bacterium]|nr:NAD-dependent epimerase/dehydratase family protein [Leptospiraceae bacterium]